MTTPIVQPIPHAGPSPHAPAPHYIGEAITDPCGVPCVVTGSSTWRDCGALVTRVGAQYADGGTTCFYSQRHDRTAA